MNMLLMRMLAGEGSENPSRIPFEILNILRISLIVVMTLCALFIVTIVLFQPGNSQGIGAIGGASETFFGKNKSKTLEGKMKRLTVISIIVFGVLSIAFFVIQLI